MLQDIILYGIIQAPTTVTPDTTMDGQAALAALESYTSQVGTYVKGQVQSATSDLCLILAFRIYQPAAIIQIPIQACKSQSQN